MHDKIAEIRLMTDSIVEILFPCCHLKHFFLRKKRKGKIQLHITVYHQYLLTHAGQCRSHIGTAGGLSAAALIICKTDRYCISHYSLPTT